MERNAKGQWNEKLKDATFHQPTAVTQIPPGEGGVSCVTNRGRNTVPRQQGEREPGSFREGGIQAEPLKDEEVVGPQTFWAEELLWDSWEHICLSQFPSGILEPESHGY